MGCACVDGIRLNGRKYVRVIKASQKRSLKIAEWKPSTHQTSAQAEDGRVLALGVDVSTEKAVAHIAGVSGLGVRVVALLLSQVCHRVRGRDKAGVCG